MPNVLVVDDEAALRAQVDAVVTGVRAGVRVYLIKPVSPDDLRHTLRASLEEHAMRVRDGVSTRCAPLS